MRERQLGLHRHRTMSGCTPSWAPFYCDWVRRALLADKQLGKTRSEREQRLLTGGLTVHTALRPKVQHAAQRALEKVVGRKGRVASAVAVVRPRSGRILAMAANRDFGNRRKHHQTKVNLPAGGHSGFQAGSTFKVFTLAAALDKGIHLEHTIDAPAVAKWNGGFRGCHGIDLGGWKPVHNASPNEEGRYGLVKATWESVNTYFATLERQIGVCKPWRLSKQMGIREVSTGKPVPQVPSFTLGVADTSPLQVAAAYATFAARGVYCKPLAVWHVVDADGQNVLSQYRHCHRVLSKHIADKTTSVLRGIIDGPDPYRTGAAASIGRPAAGKTGTTDDYAAAWFSGYTPRMAASVWTGDPRGGARHPLKNVRINGRFYPRVFGGTIGAPVWRATMARALKGTKVRHFHGLARHVAKDVMKPPPKPAEPHATGEGTGTASPSPAPKPTPDRPHDAKKDKKP